MVKKYCVTERWVVDVRYHVEAESESEACQKIAYLYPTEEAYEEVLETFVNEINEEK